jgi:hypothetical protein
MHFMIETSRNPVDARRLHLGSSEREVMCPGSKPALFDLGKLHGPTSDPRGIDCGCGWGLLCDTERAGSGYTLCGARRHRA